MSQKQPHIVLITTDELRKDALSCYGNRVIQTPHLDRLAAEGVQFNRAYTNSPWCLPSRCSLATGLYPHNNGAYSNFRDISLDPELPNIYTTLKQGGYTTAHIGKCHFAPVPYSETRPDVTLPYDQFRQYYLSLGMDHLDLQDDKQVSVWFCDDYSRELDEAGYLEAYRDATWDRGNRKVFAFPGPSEWHPDSWVGRKSAEYIDAYDNEEPLFLWVSFSGPHYPFDPPAEYLSRVNMDLDHRIYRDDEFDDPSKIHSSTYHGLPNGAIDGLGVAPDKATKNYSEAYWHKLRQYYFANVAQIDDYVGHILKSIESQLGDNVLVIFTADHGEMLGNHGLWGKNNCAYEDVWNVPLIVNFPENQSRGDTNNIAMLIDILPTCLETAGIDYSFCDGQPLSQRRTSGGAEYAFAEGEGYFAVTDGTYKLVRVSQGDRAHTELIDLSQDPSEFENHITESSIQSHRIRLQNQMVDLLMRHALK